MKNLLKAYYPAGASKEKVLSHEYQILHKAWNDRYRYNKTNTQSFLYSSYEAKSVLVQIDHDPDYLSD